MGAAAKHTFNLKFAKSTVTISANKLTSFNTHLRRSTVSLIRDDEKKEQFLKVILKNMTFNYTFNFKVDTTPNYFGDQGRANMRVKNMTLLLNFKINATNENGL